MNSEKSELACSFMPALAMVILLGFEYASDRGYIQLGTAVYGLTTLCAFGLPLALTVFLTKGMEEKTVRTKGIKWRFLSFIVLMSVALVFMSIIINWLLSMIFSGRYVPQSTLASSGADLWQILLVSAVAPAVMEELFFRGALLSGLESRGFYPAMIMSALAFAPVHGDIYNIGGPFFCGLMYGYMTYITGSVWSAVVAHLINNSLMLFITYLIQRYSAVGLWRYFLILVFLLFFILLYFSAGKLEKLIEKGKVPRIKRGSLFSEISAVAASPGLWLLIVIFAFRSVYL